MQSLQLQNDTLIDIATFLARRWSGKENVTVGFSKIRQNETRLKEKKVLLMPNEHYYGNDFQKYRQFRVSIWYEAMRLKHCEKILSNDHAYGFILNAIETRRIELVGIKVWKGMVEELIFNYTNMWLSRANLGSIFGKARTVEAFYQYFLFGDIKGEIQPSQFTSRVGLQAVNKKVLESLIVSGSMDHLEGSRAEKVSTIDIALRYGQNIQSERYKNQVDLFGDSGNGSGMSMVPDLQEVRPWSDGEALANEKGVLGLYLTGHPLLEYADDLEDFSNHDFTESIQDRNLNIVRIGGAIQNYKIHFDRKNKQMAFFTLECLGGHAEILVFSNTFAKYKKLLSEDKIVFVSGKPTDNADFSDLKLVADEIVPLEKVRDYYAKSINLQLELEKILPQNIEDLHSLSKQYPGSCNLMFHYNDENQRKKRILSHNMRVSSSREFLTKLRDIYGKSNVWVL